MERAVSTDSICLENKKPIGTHQETVARRKRHHSALHTINVEYPACMRGALPCLCSSEDG